MQRSLSTLQTGRQTNEGSALIAAIIMVSVLAFIAGTVLMTAVPAYRSTYHAAAWQEARLAADAGIDLGVAAIQNSLPNTNSYTWPDWKLADGSPVPPGSNETRFLTPPTGLLVNTGDGSTQPTIVRIEVDVITRDDNISRNPWYRIRSTGSADIASSQLGLNKRDAFLRRISFQRNRVTRTVEVLVRPLYLWEYALKTASSMTLGGGTDWKIDSYDSRWSDLNEDPNDPINNHRGSTNGMYDLAKSGAFGNIASSMARPLNSPYGVLIDAEGALVRGEVQTNGGDNPDTEIPENVEEAERIDPSRIRSDFFEVLLPPEDPLAPAITEADKQKVVQVTAPWNNTWDAENPVGPLPSSKDARGTTPETPVRIMLKPKGNQSQGGFTVAQPPPGTTRFVEIYVNANLDLGGGGIEIPPNVYVKLFVNGNLNFRNQDLNYSAASSRTPRNLQMYGLARTGSPRVDSSGNGHIVGVFYGPQYAGNLDGNTEIMGGFVLNTYNIAGGGGSGGDSVGAGFHYDEALGVIGPIQAYKVVNYFEDTRKDVE